MLILPTQESAEIMPREKQPFAAVAIDIKVK
jgi:hypothetical protein